MCSSLHVFPTQTRNFASPPYVLHVLGKKLKCLEGQNSEIFLRRFRYGLSGQEQVVFTAEKDDENIKEKTLWTVLK